MRRLLGIVVVASGLCLMASPFVSVALVAGEAIAQLPDLGAVETETDRNWTAMFSDGFVLGTRSYSGVSGEQLIDALILDGFERQTSAGEQVWAKECCGSYDAAWVKVEELGNGEARAVVSVFDNDIQASWPVIAFLGLLVVFGGRAIIGSGASGRTLDISSMEAEDPGERNLTPV